MSDLFFNPHWNLNFKSNFMNSRDSDIKVLHTQNSYSDLAVNIFWNPNVTVKSLFCYMLTRDGGKTWCVAWHYLLEIFASKFLAKSIQIGAVQEKKSLILQFPSIYYFHIILTIIPLSFLIFKGIQKSSVKDLVLFSVSCQIPPEYRYIYCLFELMVAVELANNLKGSLCGASGWFVHSGHL